MIEQLGLDSQSLLCLILQIEEEFGLDIDESTLCLEDVQSLEGLRNLIMRYEAGTEASERRCKPSR